jgi:hypothetical protein
MALKRSSFKAKPTRKCKICANIFERRTMEHVICNSPACRVELAIRAEAKSQAKQAKAARMRLKDELQSDRDRKKALRTLNEECKLTEAVMNKYVRLRDRHLGCVSCDKPTSWHGQWHASHFRSVKAASAVRFNLWNIHKSCSVCNNFDSGNISNYEPRLREKIGDEKVEWLKTQNQTSDYTFEYLARMRKIFSRKIRRIEKA